MRKNWILFCFILLAITACGERGVDPEEIGREETSVHLTAVSQATMDAEISLSLTPVATSTPTITATPIPTLDRTRPPVHSPTPGESCDKAAAGSPLDVTIPDGTLMTPGQSFSKTWRLRNAGSCTWTRLYTVTFFSSNSMNAFQTHYLPNPVEPGETIDITIDMVAPQSPGNYQGNWMLQNTEGELFGLGPHGDAPFWVKIQVVAELPATPSPSPTVTRTPVVLEQGEVNLVNNDQLDLDTGVLNPADEKKPDLQYQYGGSPLHTLNVLNNTRWAVLGDETPTLKQCRDAALTSNAISFNQVPKGTYICFRSSDGLPGWILLEDFTANTLSIRFLTWYVP